MCDVEIFTFEFAKFSWLDGDCNNVGVEIHMLQTVDLPFDNFYMVAIKVMYIRVGYNLMISNLRTYVYYFMQAPETQCWDNAPI